MSQVDKHDFKNLLYSIASLTDYQNGPITVDIIQMKDGKYCVLASPFFHKPWLNSLQINSSPYQLVEELYMSLYNHERIDITIRSGPMKFEFTKYESDTTDQTKIQEIENIADFV